jgi:hypothetical protein
MCRNDGCHLFSFGNGQIRLARPGGADAERQVVMHDRIEVLLLPVRLGLDGMALGVDVNFVGGAFAVLAFGLADGLADVVDAQPVLATEFLLHLLEDRRGLTDLLGVAAEAQFILTTDDLHGEGIADHAQVAIGRPKEGQFFVGLFEGNAKIHGYIRKGVACWQVHHPCNLYDPGLAKIDNNGASRVAGYCRRFARFCRE